MYKTKFQHSIIVCMFCFLCLPIVHMISFSYKFSFTCVKKKPKTHSCGQFRTFFGRMNGILHDDADILFCFFRHWKISSMYSSFQVIIYQQCLKIMKISFFWTFSQRKTSKQDYIIYVFYQSNIQYLLISVIPTQKPVIWYDHASASNCIFMHVFEVVRRKFSKSRVYVIG